MLRSVARLGFLALLILAAPALASPRPQDPYRLKVAVELLNLEVTVTDSRGEFVRGLARERFRVFDDGIERPLTYFAATEAPAHLLVLVETSPAVFLIHRQHLDAAFALLDALAPQDAVALMTYDLSHRLLLDFSTDKRALFLAMQKLRYSLGSSELNLFSSLAAALDAVAAIPGKKSILLVSTGLDTAPPAAWDSLLERLRHSDAVIFPVALGGELRRYRSKPTSDADARPALSFELADRRLEEIARLTGGQTFFPQSARDFPALYARLAARLRHTYLLGFSPAARDGSFRRIEVQLLDSEGRLLAPVPAERRPRFRLYHRPGYLAPKD